MIALLALLDSILHRIRDGWLNVGSTTLRCLILAALVLGALAGAALALTILD